MEPSVAHGFGRRGRILPVSGHDILAADDDLAPLAGRQFAPLVVEDPQFKRLQQHARRTEAVLVPPGRVGRDDRSRLRKAVALEHGDADGIEKALELAVEQGAAADEETQLAAERLPHLREEDAVEESHGGFEQEPPAAPLRVPVLIIGVGCLQRQPEKTLRSGALGPDRAFDALAEILGKRRHREQEMGLHLADVERNVLQGLHRGPADLHGRYGRSAGDHDVESHDMRETVVERQDDERAVPRRNIHASQRLLDIGRVVAVGQNDPFRIGRRPRGVGDGGVVVVPQTAPDSQKLLAMRPQSGLSPLLQLAERDFARHRLGRLVEENHVAQRRQPVADAAHLLQLRARHEDGRDLGVVQPEQQIVLLLQLDGEGNADGSGIEQSQLGDDPGVATLGEDRHGLLGFDAQRSQSGADAQGLLADGGIRGPLPAVRMLLEQEILLPVLSDRRFEEVDDGLFH